MLKKIRQLCKNKKGFTLVELMATFTLTAIFMTAAVLVMSSFLKVYYRTNNIAQSTSLSDMLQENITSELSLAALAPKDDTGGSDTSSVSISKGGNIDTISFRDKNGNLVQMTAKDGRLLLHYPPQNEGESDDSEAADWGYTGKVYLGNKITKLTFTHNKGNVIKIEMTLKNDKTGYSVNSKRTIQCFNLEEGDIKTE